MYLPKNGCSFMYFMYTLCTSRLLSVLVDILGRKAVFVLVTRSGQSVQRAHSEQAILPHIYHGHKYRVQESSSSPTDVGSSRRLSLQMIRFISSPAIAIPHTINICAHAPPAVGVQHA